MQEERPKGQKYIPKRNVYAWSQPPGGVSGKKNPGNAAWKDRQKTWTSIKRKSTNSGPAPKKKVQKLSLLKSFNTTLATDVMLLEAEANHFIDKFKNRAFDDASKD